MRKRNLPESRRHAPVNSVFRNTTASMRSATARERTRHTARSALAPGNGIKRSTTIRTHHPPRQTDPHRRTSHPTRPGLSPPQLPCAPELFYAGDPAVGAGSRSASCGAVSSCADDDGSATVGSGEADVGCSLGVGCGSDVRVGVGDALGGAGTPASPARRTPERTGRPPRTARPRATPTPRPPSSPACRPRACRRRRPRPHRPARTPPIPRRAPHHPAAPRNATASRSLPRRPRPRSCSRRQRRRP